MWWSGILACAPPAVPEALVEALAGQEVPDCAPRAPVVGEPIDVGSAARAAAAGVLCVPEVRSLVTALAPVDGDRLVVGVARGDAAVWSLRAGSRAPLRGSGAARALAADGAGAVLVGGDGQVARWTLDPPIARWSVASPGEVVGLARAADGARVLAATRRAPSGGAVTWWAVDGGVPVQVQTVDAPADLWCARAAPAGAWEVCAADGLWRLGARDLADRAAVYSGDTVYAADARADGALALALAAGGGRVALGGAVTELRRQATVRDVAWSPLGDLVALVSWDGALTLLDPARRVAVATLALGAGRAQVVRWSPDARWVAVGGDGGLVHVVAVAPP